MAVDHSFKLLTEVIQQNALIVLYDNLNTAITSMSAAWTTANNAFYTELGRSNPGWTVQTIENSNFYAGIVPSLINATPDKYPNVCAVAYNATPRRDDFDNGENYLVKLAIQVMVKAEDELECNNRIQKTMEAVHSVMVDNRTLGGTVNGLRAPLQEIGDVFAGRHQRNVAERWCWQGGTLEYLVDKYVDLSY